MSRFRRNVRPVARAPRTTERRAPRRNRATSSRQPAGGSPARGDARVPGSAAPGVGRDPGVEAGRGATGQSAASSEACGVVRNPRASGPRGSRACIPVAKAMDGTWEPGAGAKEPSGVGGVERSEGCRGNWREPPWPRTCGVWEATPAYNRRPGKWRAAERQSEGVVVPLEDAGQHNPARGKDPCFIDAGGAGRGSVSAR